MGSISKSVKRINYVDLSRADVSRREMMQRWGHRAAAFLIWHKWGKRSRIKDLEAVNCKLSLGTLPSQKFSLFPVKGIVKSVESIPLNIVPLTSNHRFTLLILFPKCLGSVAQLQPRNTGNCLWRSSTAFFSLQREYPWVARGHPLCDGDISEAEMLRDACQESPHWFLPCARSKHSLPSSSHFSRCSVRLRSHQLSSLKTNHNPRELSTSKPHSQH